MFRSWKTWIGNVEMAGEIYTRAVLSFTRRSDLETRFEDEGREGEGSQGRGLSHTKIQFYKNIELVMRNSRWVTLVADKNSKKPARSWLVHATAPSHAPGQWEKSTPLCALSPSSPPPPSPSPSPRPPFTLARGLRLRSSSTREGGDTTTFLANSCHERGIQPISLYRYRILDIFLFLPTFLPTIHARRVHFISVNIRRVFE